MRLRPGLHLWRFRDEWHGYGIWEWDYGLGIWLGRGGVTKRLGIVLAIIMGTDIVTEQERGIKVG